MEQIFHGQFSLYDAAIFGYKYIKIPLKAKRMGKKVALSGNFNILKAKKVLQEYNFYSKVEPFKMIFLGRLSLLGKNVWR